MDQAEMKRDLHRALGDAREAMVWKVDGLSEYDRRRPLSPTGTNLLGLVKHLTVVELLHLGWAFDRPVDDPPSWCVYGTDESDFWALPQQPSSYILEQYRRAGCHADSTIDALDLDAVGRTPWGPGEITLHRMLVHVVAEMHRHIGHADIVRENIDGAVGKQPQTADLRSTATSWLAQYEQIERAAAAAKS